MSATIVEYERIAPTFTALARQARPDETRPSIEHYRRRDEIDLLLPVAPGDEPSHEGGRSDGTQ